MAAAGEARLAALGYLGAVVLGPVIPLVLYLVRARKSPFLRYHTVAAVNLSLSWLLYEVCCAIGGGLRALDSVAAALVIALPIGVALWVTMLVYLIRGVRAADQDEARPIPQWICAPMLH